MVNGETSLRVVDQKQQVNHQRAWPLSILGCIFLLFQITTASGQLKRDTTVILISDLSVQLEASDALKYLYNFKFEKAEEQFKSFKQKYRWHPLPYFMVGLAEWWKIMPNMKETKYDEKFLTYMDSSIRSE